MEERKKNLCAMIPESLHKKVREEQEEWGIKLNEYICLLYTSPSPRDRG